MALASLRTCACALALAVTSASCASVMTGSSDEVTVDTSPQGAFFHTNTGHSGTTPARISIPDDVDLQVHFTLAGYLDADTVLDSRTSGWIWGNLLLGGLIGLAIDLGTGNYRTHDGELVFHLTKVQG